MSEERDPRHTLIIDLIIRYNRLGHEDKAKELKDKLEKLETFEQLDSLYYTCQRIIHWLS